MRRREFITFVGGVGVLLAAPDGWAQLPQQVRRIGVLLPLDENDPEAKTRLRQFRLGMRDLDWIEERNIVFDVRFTGTGSDSIKRGVVELIKAAPDVIIVYSSPGTAAVRRATSTIPIVFVNISDPVGQGFVPNFAHPGGNITGFTFIEPEIVGKWINLLSDLKRDLSRVALMFNPETSPINWDIYYRSFKTSPQQSAIEVEVVHVRTVSEIESEIAKLADRQGTGLILGPDNFLVNMRASAIKSANERGVPTISAFRQFVVDGSLVSYGPDTGDLSRRASAYVDRILKGEQPGNLPVQSPFRFELVVNLKTAKTLGLSVRDSFLELCDEIIEW
jgi:putative ABC transport system substrate-binding protein